MASVPSIDRQKASTVFRSIAQSHVRDVLPVVEDRLREVLSGEETLPDVSFLATLLERVQIGGTRRLTQADNTHDEELANDSGPRQRRDEVGGRVYGKLVEVRRIADGLFGPARSGELIGTSGPTAPVTEGERLWRQAEDTANRLEAPGFTAPVMTTSSLQFDPLQLASELRSLNDAFREALDAVAMEERKAEASLEAKNARLADAQRVDAACARIYQGFFLLADRGDLAERFLRALRRRTRRRVSSPGDVTPAPGSGPPPDGPPAPDGPPPAGEPFAAASSND
jgi:hypothetical protein